MTRFFLFWGILTAVYFVGRLGTSALAFRHLDLTLGAVAQTLLVPCLQAAILVLLARKAHVYPLRETLPELASRRVLVGLFGADLLVTILGCSFRTVPFLGFAGPWSLPALLVVVKSAAAAAFAGSSALDGTAPARERWRLLVLSAGMAAYGVDAVTGWLQRSPETFFPSSPLAVRWIATALPLFLGTLLVILAAAGVARGRRNPAWLLFETASALVAFCGVAIFLSVYLRPYLLEPWRVAVSAAAYLAHALVFLGCLALKAGSRSVPPESVS